MTDAPSSEVWPILATDPPSIFDYGEVIGDRRPRSEVRCPLACVGLWREAYGAVHEGTEVADVGAGAWLPGEGYDAGEKEP
ncbi:hypothetical protein V6Z12_A04G023200 [Gossypium hirsutum]